MSLFIPSKVRHKLTSKHGVSEAEIVQCFANRARGFLEDNREEHASDPPTRWFVAETDYGRQLKVVFLQHSDGTILIKTAYEANSEEKRIYGKYA
nr:ADP-ribosyl-(dinitrogen reductase) hydrolase [Gammaproteobacteria bacterium]